MDNQRITFGIIALLFLIAGVIGLNDVFIPMFWHKVKGKILHSKIVSREIEYEEFASSPPVTKNVRSLQVRYEYQVDGQRYFGTRIARSFLGRPSERDDFLYKYVSHSSRYSVGATVDVYVDPNNPRESVLVKLAIGPLILFSLLLLIAVFYLTLVIFNIYLPLSIHVPVKAIPRGD